MKNLRSAFFWVRSRVFGSLDSPRIWKGLDGDKIVT